MKKLISLLVIFGITLTGRAVFSQETSQDSEQITNPTSSELVVTEVVSDEPDDNANGQAEEPNIQELIVRLEQAECNNVPIYFSLDEMNTFLEQAPADIIETMIKHIEKFAEPAPMPIVDINTNLKQHQQRSDTYLSYDFSTQTEQVLPFDNSDPNTTVQESEGSDVNEASYTYQYYGDIAKAVGDKIY